MKDVERKAEIYADQFYCRAGISWEKMKDGFFDGYSQGQKDLMEDCAEKSDSSIFNSLNFEWFEKHKKELNGNDEFIGHTALHFFRKAWQACALQSRKEIDELKERNEHLIRMKEDACRQLAISLDSEMKKEAQLKERDEKIAQLENELHQQRFNNEHNLSIDQKIADKIKELDEKIKSLMSDLETCLNALKFVLNWDCTDIKQRHFDGKGE